MEGAISRGNGGANPNGELGNGVDIRRGWKCEQKKVCDKKKKKKKKEEKIKKLEIVLKSAERIFVYRCDPASEYLESISGGAVDVKKNL